MGNKKYVLGNYELKTYEAYLLTKCINSKIYDNNLFIDTHFLTTSMEACFNAENETLKLMLEELRKYGD